MYIDRKEYRKNFTSAGQLYMAGETLEFISHDVSVQGISIEVVPGRLLAEYADFETYIKENRVVEIFVKELMLTGEAEVIWLRQEQGAIMMGLEFHDTIYNADRLWLKRQFYRKERSFSGFLLTKNKRFEFEGKNISVDGAMIFLKELDASLVENSIIRLYSDSESFSIKATAKICWITEETAPEGFYLGLRYLDGK
ncbi:MAG: PilZ domain-containing protein [Gammaproteobacteria bacterium HGW-Gammaproteobacteria-3]|nr:MAG: PilZ domain-containing protein [Gammaproteobacteria bacterium HGW-Gammaproteobacteria-3]